MGLSISYKTLFEVKIIHHYFLNKGNDLFDNMIETDKARIFKNYDVRDYLNIAPTQVCADLLKRNKCIYTNTTTGFIVMVKVTEKNNKLLPETMDNTLFFSFAVTFKDPLFSNYTLLPLKRIKSNVYYLNNRKERSFKKFPYLTLFPNEFELNKKYSSGDMLSNNINNPTQLFIAKKLTATNPTVDVADWIKDDLVQPGAKPILYVTGEDQLPVYGDLLRQDTDIADLTVNVKVTNQAGIEFTPKHTIVAEHEKSVALVELQTLKEGPYTIKIDGINKPFTKTFSFYRLRDNAAKNMLIDISAKRDAADVADPADTYNFLNADGSLKSRVYELRFRNRFTNWRYIGKKLSTKPTVGPHPLTLHGSIDISIKNDDNVMLNDLPNPSVNLIKPELPVDDKDHYNVFSEIYIN